jgi:hypothetical protein
MFDTKKMFSLASIVTLLASFCLVVGAISASAKTTEPAKRQVVFLPFTVEIPGSYAYLRQGLASMLASRLASRVDIAAVAQGGATEQMAKSLKAGDNALFSQQLRQSGADYLVLGSLTVKGERFELTSYVFSNTAGETPKKFQRDVASIDNAMTAIDDLAWDISSGVFGQQKPEEAPQTAGKTAFQTAHPERAYREGRLIGSASGLETGGIFELTANYRSKNLLAEVMDINAGDIDGDGKDEIVVLTKSSLILYRQTEGQFQMLATIDLPKQLHYLSVTMADINKNGLQEIYISGSNGETPDSSAIEWNGKKMTYLFQHAPYYLRAMTVAGQSPVLLGQTTLAGELGGADICQMTLDPQKGVIQGKKLNLPEGINLFDFAQGDINGDGKPETIAINKNNRLQVFDAAGTLLWTSSEQYGASNNFFGTLTSNSNTDKETVYLKTRIEVADLNLDGVNDVLVGRNRLETVKFMPHLRYFEGSSIAALKWEKGALATLWETRKIPGYVINYQMLPLKKGNRQFQLIFAEGESSSPFVFWHSPSAFINSYSLRVN